MKYNHLPDVFCWKSLIKNSITNKATPIVEKYNWWIEKLYAEKKKKCIFYERNLTAKITGQHTKYKLENKLR